MSPDPYDGSMDLGNPQSLNRYAYVGNNPLAFTDPSGLVILPPPPPIDPVEIAIDAVIGAVAIGELVEGLFYHPSFTGSTAPRPQVRTCISANCGTVDHNPLDLPNQSGGFPVNSGAPFMLTAVGFMQAPHNSAAPKSNGCMIANGKTVCVSPIDKYNFLHPGDVTHYRDSNSRCSQHTVLDNTTGRIVDNHIDEFNPNYYFVEHVVLDVVPDVIYNITGRFLFPTGNRFCQ